MGASPCGWNLPMQSPTMRADFLYARFHETPIRFIVWSTRRCTGFRPSRMSGRARPTMTDIAWSRYSFRISSSMGTGVCRSGDMGLLEAGYRLDVQVHDVQRVLLDEIAAGLDGIAHEDSEYLVGAYGIFHGDLEERARLRVHRGLP